MILRYKYGYFQLTGTRMRTETLHYVAIPQGQVNANLVIIVYKVMVIIQTMVIRVLILLAGRSYLPSD